MSDKSYKKIIIALLMAVIFCIAVGYSLVYVGSHVTFPEPCEPCPTCAPCPTPDKPQAISDLTALIADYVELYDKGWGATDAEWVEWMRDFLDWEAEYYE